MARSHNRVWGMRTTTEQRCTLLTKFRGPLTGETLFGPFTERDRTETCFVTRKDRLRVVHRFPSGIVDRAKRERAWKSPHARKARRGREREKARLSRMGWFSCALAFRSIYYPWGKMRDYSQSKKKGRYIAHGKLFFVRSVPWLFLTKSTEWQLRSIWVPGSTSVLEGFFCYRTTGLSKHKCVMI